MVARGRAPPGLSPQWSPVLYSIPFLCWVLGLSCGMHHTFSITLHLVTVPSMQDQEDDCGRGTV
jgi:hypothetical protein